MTVPFADITQLYINGNWQAPSNGHEPIVNPATEAVIGEAPVGGRDNVEAALQAARRAFDEGPWPRLTFGDRIEVIRRLRLGIERRADEIRQLLIAEVGSSYMMMASAQFQGALDAIDYAIKLAGDLGPEPSPLSLKKNPFQPGERDLFGAGVTVYDPFGVVLGITPYNFPFFLNVVKLVPAMLAGNTVVLKPSELTPFCALLLGELAEETGVPAGVLNIVTGGQEVGEELTRDPRVDMVTFTGSDEVGASIMKQAADTLKKVHLELGGKSALIVREDADVTEAATIAALNISIHAGQGCALLTRHIVHNSLRPAFVETVKAVLATLKIGDPADPEVVVGPLIRESARQKTERYVQLGLDSGARLVCGGKRPEGLDRGFFFEPTLFDGVENGSNLAQDEIFGPVGVVIGFDDDEEAIRLANDSRFGLSGAVMSADSAAAYRMALRLRTGGVAINGGTGDLFLQLPFGGYRRSGLGREFGPGWLKEYMQEKAITYPVG